MSDYPMLISNKLHSFRNFVQQVHYQSLSYTMKQVYHSPPFQKQMRLTTKFSHCLLEHMKTETEAL
mgnify:CR=1 FL=1